MAGQSYFVQRMGIEEGPYGLGDLRRMVDSSELYGEDLVRDEQAPGKWFRATNVPGLYSRREWLTALLLSIFVGGLGIDRFYLGQTGLGIAKLLTCGGLGVWKIIDIVLLAMNKTRDVEDLPLRK